MHDSLNEKYYYFSIEKLFATIRELAIENNSLKSDVSNLNQLLCIEDNLIQRLERLSQLFTAIDKIKGCKCNEDQNVNLRKESESVRFELDVWYEQHAKLIRTIRYENMAKSAYMSQANETEREININAVTNILNGLSGRSNNNSLLEAHLLNNRKNDLLQHTAERHSRTNGAIEIVDIEATDKNSYKSNDEGEIVPGKAIFKSANIATDNERKSEKFNLWEKANMEIDKYKSQTNSRDEVNGQTSNYYRKNIAFTKSNDELEHKPIEIDNNSIKDSISPPPNANYDFKRRRPRKQKANSDDDQAVLKRALLTGDRAIPFEEPIKCDICGLEFIGETNFKRHQLSHGQPSISPDSVTRAQVFTESYYHNKLLQRKFDNNKFEPKKIEKSSTPPITSWGIESIVNKSPLVRRDSICVAEVSRRNSDTDSERSERFKYPIISSDEHRNLFGKPRSEVESVLTRSLSATTIKCQPAIISPVNDTSSSSDGEMSPSLRGLLQSPSRFKPSQNATIVPVLHSESKA